MINTKHYFIQDCEKTLPTKSNEVQVCNPYLLGVLPSHTYDVNIEPMRWYNALMFLQIKYNSVYTKVLL